jgi:type II secretory pathway pseudopilin PulG
MRLIFNYINLKNEKGFSLLDLAIVLILIGFLLAVVSRVV